MTLGGFRPAVMHRAAVLALIVAVAGCGGNKARSPIPLGEARLPVPGGRIWYTVSGSERGTPVVLLHGGPGFSSYYLKPLEALGDERIIVRYDQLGGGKSDALADSTIWTIKHFVDELDSLRAHLGIEKWHVYGHSWGTILGVEYYRRHPDRVSSLVFASPVLDMRAYERRGTNSSVRFPTRRRAL